jgi:NAD(P)H-dependent FMN reductase
MSLVIFNGSPRGEKSNSGLMADSFVKGFSSETEENISIFYLINKKEMNIHKEEFRRAEEVIFIFPLYADAMPGIVKEFFEEVEEYDSAGKRIGFIIHSGFPETVHSACLAEYLQRFAEIIKAEYMGTVISGESESLKFVPEKMKNKKLSPFYHLGKKYALDREFNEDITLELGKLYKFNVFILIILRICIFLRIFNIMWNKELKKNGSLDKRFARPYQDRG